MQSYISQKDNDIDARQLINPNFKKKSSHHLEDQYVEIKKLK